jgi:DNA-binding XRE family transcriptional regulator
MQENGQQFVIIPIEDYNKLIKKSKPSDDEIDEKLGILAEKRAEESFPIKLFDMIDKGQNAVKTFRNYRKMSLKDLAKKTKLSSAYISQIEKNVRKGSAETLYKISKALNIPVEELI